MSLNIWQAESQELQKVAGQVNINDGATSETSVWSSKKVSANLGEKADKDDLVFKYYPMLETSNLNCNDITDYECIVTANNDNWSEMNYPVKDLLLITTHRNVDDGYQEARMYHGERKFIRTMTNKVWQPWTELATMDKVGNKCLKVGTVSGTPNSSGNLSANVSEGTVFILSGASKNACVSPFTYNGRWTFHCTGFGQTYTPVTTELSIEYVYYEL